MMKYLKKFNENNNIELAKKLREIVENHLIDLIDDGIKVEIELTDVDEYFTLMLTRYGNGFMWNDIKDHFIPFLIYIQEYYYILDNEFNPIIRFGFSNGLNSAWIPSESYTIEDILEDNDINRTDKIVTITFNIVEI